MRDNPNFRSDEAWSEPVKTSASLKSDIETANRTAFNKWFSAILLVEGQSCLIRDVLRNKREELYQEWVNVDPYGFKEIKIKNPASIGSGDN